MPVSKTATAIGTALLIVSRKHWSGKPFRSNELAAEGRYASLVLTKSSQKAGAKVFLTEQELFNLNVPFPSLSIGSFLIAGLLDLRWNENHAGCHSQRCLLYRACG